MVAYIRGLSISQIIDGVAVVEFGSVWEDEGVVGFAGIYFYVPGGDPKKQSTFIVVFAKLFDS